MNLLAFRVFDDADENDDGDDELVSFRYHLDSRHLLY